ncbi:MAG: hypothetical protein ACLFO1_02575 [Spirochaetaceae bacterium]
MTRILPKSSDGAKGRTPSGLVPSSSSVRGARPRRPGRRMRLRRRFPQGLRLLVVVIALVLLCTACRENRKGDDSGAGSAGADGSAVPIPDADSGRRTAERDGGAEEPTDQRARESRRIQLDLLRPDDPGAGPSEDSDTADATPGSAESPAPGPSGTDGGDREEAADEAETTAEREARRRISELDNPSPFVLPGGGIVRAMPRDMVIGSLQDRFPSAPDERSVASVAHRFLESLTAGDHAEGALDAAMEDVAPDRRDELREWLTFSLERYPAPRSVRLGEIEWEGSDRAWLPFVFRRGRAAAAGEVHLAVASEGEESRWHVTDVLVQFGELSDEDREEVERFEPTEYPSMRIGP